jgi:translation initiation factor 2D
MDHPKETSSDPANEALNQDVEEDVALGPSPDEILHQAVCQALVNLNNKAFPMLVTTFYSKHVIPTAASTTTTSSSSSSGETGIDLKRTKYKKFGTYIKQQIARGLLFVGPDTKNKKNTDPGAMLVGYDKNHEDVHGLSKTALAMASSAATTKNKLLVVNLYRIPSPVVSLLKLNPDDVAAANATSEERRGTGMLTSPEVKKIVEAYITKENLVNPVRKDQIILDGPLTDAIFPPKQQKQMLQSPPAMMKRKDVMQRFTARLEPAYALVQMPGSKITSLQKGAPPKVGIEVSMRQSRKFVTRVRGMEEYGIDGPVLSKDISKRLACSSTVDTEASAGRAALKKGRVELAFQGNIVDELEALLTGDESLSSHGGIKNSDYAIPLSVLDIVLRRGVPPQKKRGGGIRKK